MPLDFIVPDWKAPLNVRAVFTTRRGGLSTGPYGAWDALQQKHIDGGLNLGQHTSDQKNIVYKNRQRVSEALDIAPVWLHQVHGTQVLILDQTFQTTKKHEHFCVDASSNTSVLEDHEAHEAYEADAVVTMTAGRACTVMVADCLPVLLCNQQGTVVGAVHAGWRGLCAGVIESAVQTLMKISCEPHQQWLAWLGPCIGPRYFEIGEEVRSQFLEASISSEHQQTEACFKKNLHHDRITYFADLCGLASIRLSRLGIFNVTHSAMCTYQNREQFYSYRRDGAQTGRMAAMIWLHDV